MRVLLTGQLGKLGATVQSHLLSIGHEVRGFDKRDGLDIRDRQLVSEAVPGCEAIVHLAADMRHGHRKTASILRTNVTGTENLLAAAAEAGVHRFVFISSVGALGIFRGLSKPDYLPIDDSHPTRPAEPYGLSKRLAEELCAYYARISGIEVICLRLPAVRHPQDYAKYVNGWRGSPESEWVPAWEYGAFLDVRDLVSAVEAALICPSSSPEPLLLCAQDIAATRPSRKMVERLLPGIEWRGGVEYEADPYRALVDSRRARAMLAWQPRHTWRDSTANL